MRSGAARKHVAAALPNQPTLPYPVSCRSKHNALSHGPTPAPTRAQEPHFPGPPSPIPHPSLSPQFPYSPRPRATANAYPHKAPTLQGLARHRRGTYSLTTSAPAPLSFALPSPLPPHGSMNPPVHSPMASAASSSARSFSLVSSARSLRSTSSCGGGAGGRWGKG